MKNTLNSTLNTGVFLKSEIGFTNLIQLSAENYTTGRMNQIVKLTVLLTVCCVVRGQCDGLTVYDGDRKINTSTVCIRQYTNAESIAFYESFNQSLLPEGFPTSSLSVQRPSSVTVEGIETPFRPPENSEDYMYPGLSIQWWPPYSGISRSSCFGYLVSWFAADGSGKMCQLFHINSMPKDTLRFQYNIKKVNQSKDYFVRVYSMPPDGPLLKDNEESFVHAQIATPAAYRTGNPNEWSPFVGYDILNNGTIHVTVSLAPANFNITEFKMYLMTNSSENVVDTLSHSSQIRTDMITDFSVPLTARSSDFYYVRVWAQDKFSMQPGLCQCWAWLNNMKTCKNSCGGTQTSLFYVNITNPPPVVPTSAPPALTTTFDSTVEPDDVPLALIIGVVVAVVALLALVIISVCLFRNKSKVKYLIQRCRRRYPDSQYFTGHEYTPAPLPQSGAVPNLSRKTVYLISADDHEAHVRLTEALASFLEVHCRCRVILPSRRNPYETGAYEWVINSISKSDFIMFVNSEGAQKMIEAHLNKTSYTSRKVGPEGDLFNFSLKHIFLNDEVREESLILVSFHGKHCQKYLQVPHVFKLPKHLRYLLQKIHQLDSSAISSCSKVLPLNVENIENLPEGVQMISASKYVKIYEESNPQWFENNFGDLRDPKPLCDRGWSVDSGYSASDRLTSVSRQNSFRVDSLIEVPEHIQYPSAPPLLYRPAATNYKTDYKDTVDNGLGNMPVDKISCVTIKEVREQMDERRQEPYLDKESLVPPESASQIICDSHSTAMSAINKNNHDYDDEIRDIYEDSFQKTIIPPQNPSDIQLDSVSSAIADINANSEKLLRRDQFLFEDEAIGSVSQFDSVSV